MWSKLYSNQPFSVGTVTSRYVILHDWMALHALQYTISGSGRVTIEAESSIGGESWVSNGVVVRNAIATSGPGGDGTDIIPLKLKIAEFIRFKITISTDTATLTLWFTQK